MYVLYDLNFSPYRMKQVTRHSDSDPCTRGPYATQGIISVRPPQAPRLKEYQRQLPQWG